MDGSIAKLQKIQRDSLEEVRYIKEKFSSMQDDAAVLLLLTRWYIQIGIEHGYTLHQIVQGYVENKIYEIMQQKEKSPLVLTVCCNKTRVSYYDGKIPLDFE